MEPKRDRDPAQESGNGPVRIGGVQFNTHADPEAFAHSMLDLLYRVDAQGDQRPGPTPTDDQGKAA